MKKLLIITPHLSTGGAPQVTLNKIELLKDEFDILCVEHSFIAWTFVVQRNKIIELLGDKFISLGDDKRKLLEIISSFAPDVISFEEFPEFFLDNSITKEIYRENKPYLIFETTHDSSFSPENKKWFPDKFLFVSIHNALRYNGLDIPYEIIEYPIDKKNKDKITKQKLLNFSPDYKHVVNVGLFTPRKNQKYIFEIAEVLKDYKIKFHFIGNQADNFKFYWQPLMDNKPKNCVVWYEKNNVSDFLEASDLFLFTSKGDKNNKELNPIAIKEALMYDMPMMMFNLDVYCGKYDKEPNINFLTGDLYEDSKNILDILKPEKISENDEVIVISTYPNTSKRIELTKNCIESFRKLGRKIILVSHYPVPAEIQSMADFYVFDSDNILTIHSYYTYFYSYTSEHDVRINFNNLKNTNQSLAAHMNFYNGVKMAKSIGASKVMIVTYDVILNELDIPAIEEYFKKLTEWKCCIAFMDTTLGKGIETTSMIFNIDYFTKIFKDIRSESEYNNHCEYLGCQNFLEDYYMTILKNEQDLWVVPNQRTILPNSGVGVSSNSEYYSLLCMNNNPKEWMLYFHSYNLDDRRIEVSVSENNEEIFKDSFVISEKHTYMTKIYFNDSPIEASLTFFDGLEKIKVEKFNLNNETLEKYKNNGYFNEKKKDKIKLVHCQTTRNDEREQLSRQSLEPLKDLGIEYVLNINEPYTDLPPSDNCLRPQCVTNTFFTQEQIQKYGTALTPGHYGCYLSHKNAIINEFTEDVDFFILCEGDCKLEISPEDFISLVNKVSSLMVENDITYFSFGDTKTLDTGIIQSNVVTEIPNQDLIFITDHIICCHCIMFKKSDREFLIEQMNNHKWDVSDILYNSLFNSFNKKMAILKNRVTSQFDGLSLIDLVHKTYL